MSNISDYLDWRGDLAIENAPLNEVDFYLISKIGTLDFSGIVSSEVNMVGLEDAIFAYRSKYGESGSYLGALASKKIVPMVERMPKVNRFRGLRLSGFRKKIRPDDIEQFSALTITLRDGRHCITFRGTDDSILAWKENLLMSVEETVPAQKDALEYLEWAAANYEGKLIVLGHSKGGNLAEYAASCVSSDIQERIETVYSFDGPGFDAEFFKQENYKNIESKLNLLVPEHTMVGTLMTQNKPFTIIKCRKGGAAAHDGFIWEVMGSSFVRGDSLSKRSKSFDEVMDTMLANTDIEERKTIICEVFDILAQTGAGTVTDMTDHRMRQARMIVKSLRKSPNTKKFIGEMLELMAEEIGVPVRRA